jgi:hypothetical protein
VNGKILNDIDLKGIDFNNLNSDFYKDTQGIEKRDFFALGKEDILNFDSMR